MRCTVFLGLATMMALAVAPAVADPVEDYWSISIDWDVFFVEGDGTGYNDGTGEFGTPWYYYDSGWWNQWFYNAPYDPNRWKIIDFGFDIMPLDPDLDSYFEVVVNWSTGAWSDLGLGRPPLPGDLPEDEYIGRSDPLIESFFIDPAGEHFDFHYEIWDFNPEWVSIDVWGWNLQIMNGYFFHECVPEPGSLTLLALAGLLALRRR